jgi:hypothetical protein
MLVLVVFLQKSSKFDAEEEIDKHISVVEKVFE